MAPAPALARPHPDTPPEVVLLGGWGMRPAVMDALAAALGARILPLPPLADANPAGRRDAPRAWLGERLPSRAVLVGWSLGASLAIDFADAFPERVAALVCIAGNPCFCARPGWSCAVPGAVFEGFRTGVRHDAPAQLARFAALQAQGDARERHVLRALRGAVAHEADGLAALLAGLDVLQGWDLRDALARVRVPTLHVLGAADALVPPALEAELRRLQPAGSVWIARGAAHAPFLSRPEATAARIADFLGALQPRAVFPAKREVARSFGRAATRYDALAGVQSLSAARLAEHAAPRTVPDRALDLGCGTGARLPLLQARFPGVAWVAADLAEGMLRQVREHTAGVFAVGADAECMPFVTGAFDLVYSNLALQWITSPATAFVELARVLRPGGLALVGTLGPDTLWELRAAWAAVDAGVHVHRFETVDRLRDAARAAGLDVGHVALHWQVERHAGVTDVARGLRGTGAHNLDPRRARGLTGRQHWIRLGERYALFGDDEPALPATWQLVHLALEKPRD